MGYSTCFTLKVHEGNKTINEVLEDIGEKFEGLYYAVDENGDTSEGVKWYEHEDDMRYLSKLYPSEVFVLYGEGEENDDTWYKYFKNGKMQSCYAKITYDEFDESKLR